MLFVNNLCYGDGKSRKIDIPVYKLFLSQIRQCKRRVHRLTESHREKIVIVRDMTFSFSSGSSPRESPG